MSELEFRDKRIHLMLNGRLLYSRAWGLDRPRWFTLMRRTDSTRTARIVGAILAMIWLCGGVAGLIAGVVTRQWLPGVAGLMAVWYGVIWIFVARLGRRLTSREALAPWRLARRSGPGT